MTHILATLLLVACAAGPDDAEDRWTKRLAEVKERLPDKSFTVVREPPFIVIGDESPERVRKRAAGTVRWAVVQLKKRYFANDPDEILEIWLFKDTESYRKHAKGIFGDEPDTPYGYYSARNRALVMNIATGGGTLVHEIVHPFVRANFPDCPDWFNEGLGSLYEQSSERDGGIVGLTNWRLAGLQEAIREGDLPSFQALTATTDGAFYDADPGTNYAQARYLCYYLQEKGLLETFYRAFHAARKEDPTGYATLKKVLGTDDMTAFQEAWEKWVLKLTFP